MKYLIVGLGNIGGEYEGTRHNIGFDVVDRLAKELKADKFEIGRHAMHTTAKFKGRKLVILKPTTFMNLSGKAVKYWLDAENIPIDNFLVILDDLAIPLGKLRMKLKGGDGNHNGLTSIIELLKHSKFPRLRFGIGDSFSRGHQSDFVLGTWKPEELTVIDERIDVAIEMIKSFCAIGAERTMTSFNGK
ncbi:MAG: aminoacyl-tRNA hydrolase [Bacteroidetes bacterium]|nr:MAG: aminoacyl-tRNA hydrolase [Bacteroidota bacterium]